MANTLKYIHYRKKNSIMEKRIYIINYMRVLASFFVVVIHTVDISTYLGFALTTAARFSVPLFVIVSGYLMLDKKADPSYYLKKSMRLFLLMVTWALLYFLFYRAFGDITELNVVFVIKYILTQPIHLWYIYATITLYVFTPVFIVFYEHADKNTYIYCLLLTFICGSLVTTALRTTRFELLNTIVDKMKLAYLLGFVFLYLLGGFVKKYGLSKRGKRIFVISGVVSVAAAIIINLLKFSNGSYTEIFLSFFAPNSILSAAAIFAAMIDIKVKKDNVLISEIASISPGIYFVQLMVVFLLNLYIPDCAGICLFLKPIIVYFASACIAFILSKIPFLYRLVK